MMRTQPKIFLHMVRVQKRAKDWSRWCSRALERRVRSLQQQARVVFPVNALKMENLFCNVVINCASATIGGLLEEELERLVIILRLFITNSHAANYLHRINVIL